MSQKVNITTAPKAATASHTRLGQLLAGIQQAVVEESQHKEASATPAATLSPREYVAAMIDHLAATGWQGEHILQMIEKRIFALSVKDKRLVFYHSGLVSDEEAISDRTFGSKEDMQTEVQGEMVKLVMQGPKRKAA